MIRELAKVVVRFHNLDQWSGSCQQTEKQRMEEELKSLREGATQIGAGLELKNEDENCIEVTEDVSLAKRAKTLLKIKIKRISRKIRANQENEVEEEAEMNAMDRLRSTAPNPAPPRSMPGGVRRVEPSCSTLKERSASPEDKNTPRKEIPWDPFQDETWFFECGWRDWRSKKGHTLDFMGHVCYLIEILKSIFKSTSKVWRSTKRFSPLPPVDDENRNKKLAIRSTEKIRLNFQNAVQKAVECTEDDLEVMDIGSNNRAVGSTKINDRASRSCSLLTVVEAAFTWQSWLLANASQKSSDSCQEDPNSCGHGVNDRSKRMPKVESGQCTDWSEG
ncbi:hypothetical protein BSKO_09103 [Bryopsis sp. KO-2023]|nr:hypothetical protein BSKO_09103 [Bryopsis sp. KO-2023]